MEQNGDVVSTPAVEEVRSTVSVRKRVKTKKRGALVTSNLVTGTFLRSVFYLNPQCTKYVLVGVFADRENSVGILLKGLKSSTYWSPLVFNQFILNANEITKALDTPGVHKFKSDSGEDIVVKKVFGKKYAVLSDGQHSLMLTEAEWTQFVNVLPCISRQINELFLSEDVLKLYISGILASAENFVTPPEGLPGHLCDRLFDEVQYYKRWPNGGSC